jgi:hypothetical protein
MALDLLSKNTGSGAESEVDMSSGMQKNWREVCAAVTNETDPTKLASLVQELIEALDQGERSWREPGYALDTIPSNRKAASEVPPG